MDLFNDSEYYHAPDAIECGGCGRTHDPFVELDTCEDCDEECCEYCSTEWMECTVCIECVEEVYLSMGGKVATCDGSEPTTTE